MNTTKKEFATYEKKINKELQLKEIKDNLNRAVHAESFAHMANMDIVDYRISEVITAVNGIVEYLDAQNKESEKQ